MFIFYFAVTSASKKQDNAVLLCQLCAGIVLGGGMLGKRNVGEKPKFEQLFVDLAHPLREPDQPTISATPLPAYITTRLRRQLYFCQLEDAFNEPRSFRRSLTAVKRWALGCPHNPTSMGPNT